MSRMYLKMVERWFAAQFHRVWRRGVMRSGMVSGVILVALVGGLSFAYRERGHGNLHKIKHKIKAKIVTAPPQEAQAPRPGGQEALELTRMRMLGSSMPEFISVTMLPGRGLNVLQIGAFIPGKGEVNLLDSPPVESAAGAMTGKGADANGQQSLAMGGAFEVPWAGSISGVPSQTAGHISTAWRGHLITLPDGPHNAARGGLILAAASDSSDTTAFPDGGQAQAVFHLGSSASRWPSKTDVTVTVLLGSRSIDLTVVARNTGDAPEPVGIGWSPRFAIFDGNRDQLRLSIPCDKRVQVRDRQSGLPTGTLLSVAGTPYDFNAHGGVALGKMDIDDTFVAPHKELLDNGPAAELIDPANEYGLRLTAFSPDIKAFRVVAPAGDDYVSISPQFNYDDPFGSEWGKDADTGMVVLQPGQSAQWKVRLEIFSLGGSPSPL